MIHKKNEHRIASVYYLIKDRYSPNFDRYHIKLDTTATNNPLERGPVSCTNKKSQCYIIIFCIVEVKANSFYVKVFTSITVCLPTLTLPLVNTQKSTLFLHCQSFTPQKSSYSLVFVAVRKKKKKKNRQKALNYVQVASVAL